MELNLVLLLLPGPYWSKVRAKGSNRVLGVALSMNKIVAPLMLLITNSTKTRTTTEASVRLTRISGENASSESQEEKHQHPAVSTNKKKAGTRSFQKETMTTLHAPPLLLSKSCTFVLTRAARSSATNNNENNNEINSITSLHRRAVSKYNHNCYSHYYYCWSDTTSLVGDAKSAASHRSTSRAAFRLVGGGPLFLSQMLQATHHPISQYSLDDYSRY